jgi:hypothetical protein
MTSTKSSSVAVVPKTKRLLALEEKVNLRLDANLEKQKEISELIADYKASIEKYNIMIKPYNVNINIRDEFKENLRLNPKSKELREKYAFYNKSTNLEFKIIKAFKKLNDFKKNSILKKKREFAKNNYDFELSFAAENEKHTEKLQTKSDKNASMKFDLKSLERLPEDMVRVIGEFLPAEILLGMREKQFGSFTSLFKVNIVITVQPYLMLGGTVSQPGGEYNLPIYKIKRFRLAALKIFTRYKNELSFFERTATDFQSITEQHGGRYKLEQRMNLLYTMLKRENPKLAYNIYNYFFLKIGNEKTVKPAKKTKSS